MSKFLFNFVKKIIPRISDTELVALRSGTTSLDRHLFQGRVDLPPKNKDNTPNKFLSVTDDLLGKFDNQKVYPNPNSNEILDFIKENKFFSLIIDQKYQGNKLSVNNLSSVLVKITSHNPSLGVTIMVPNSLGPGELLAHYGTSYQKEKYLSGLANGEYIPCFGLTGPNNGSDAAGQIDEGVVKMVNNKRKICVSINKRYITLAPVSNLVGLAFRLKDPDNLLEKGQEGITVALIEGDHEGLIKSTHHNPLNAGFPNGTLKGDLEIDIDQIIGGEENSGNGWKMLMECLAAGRAICLPATALASSKVASYGILNYAKHRKQFNIPLVKMEGVNEKLLEMFYQTWVIQSSIKLTNTLLDNGEKPAVISALMKQQTTERGRIVLNMGMDIHGGSAICYGKNNFLEKFYQSAPIGITVEGSNTLTRSLIIFGQGLNKSHPYIYPILESVMNNDLKQFRTGFRKMFTHSIKMYYRSFDPLFGELEKQTVDFSCLSNFVALKGGKIKMEQYLSGEMADIFSNLYLAHSIKWYQQEYDVSSKFSDYCINRLLNENRLKINNVINNIGWQKYLLLHLKRKHKPDNYLERREVLKEILENEKIVEHIKEDIYTKDTVLEKLESLNDEDNINYQEIYDDVISVGEYPNE